MKGEDDEQLSALGEGDGDGDGEGTGIVAGGMVFTAQ